MAPQAHQDPPAEARRADGPHPHDAEAHAERDGEARGQGRCGDAFSWELRRVENSTEGVVNHTLDLFVDSSLLIYGEVMLEISHHFLSKAQKIEDIKTVYSHPHAIAQCRNWLETHLPSVSIVEEASTARAAERCVNDPAAGAIASELAAQLYGLTILRSRIEDNINNFTRFLILSLRGAEQTGRDKTSFIQIFYKLQLLQ